MWKIILKNGIEYEVIQADIGLGYGWYIMRSKRTGGIFAAGPYMTQSECIDSRK